MKTINDADYINEHRVACGRRRLLRMDKKAIKKHLALIEFFAPYGQDPWEKYSKADIAILKEAASVISTAA